MADPTVTVSQVNPVLIVTPPATVAVQVQTPAVVLQLTGGMLGGGSSTGADSIAGTTTLTLVNDSASPGNSMLYGTNGSGVLGWYAQPTGGSSSTGADSITGTTTLTLVNDVVTPTNGQFYGYSGGARGWFTPAGGGDVMHTRQILTQYSLTGGGDLSADRTLNLVNDVSAPGNNYYYGTNSSGVRNWLATSSLSIAWGQLTGVPGTFSPSGNLNTQYSITGGAALSTSPTINLVGDVASPGNNYLYGTNGSGTRGWYAESTLSIAWSQLTGIPTNTTAQAGIVGTAPNDINKFWRGDASWNFDVYVSETNGTFTVPAVGATVAITVVAPPSFTYAVGQSLFITDGTRVLLCDITVVTSQTSLTVKNQGYQGNSTSGTMATGSPIHYVGPGLCTATQPGFVPAPPNSAAQTLLGTGAFGSLAFANLGSIPTLTTQYSLTGGGTLGALTLNLVGDVATPTNGQFYGYSGSARGWYTPPSFAGSSVGYVPSSAGGTTNFLRADGTWAVPPGGSGGTLTIARFRVGDGNPPATNYGYFGTRDTGVLGVWQFAHAGTDTAMIFADVVPQNTTFTTGIKVIIFWASTSATTGAVEWKAEVDNVNAHSIDTDTYGTAVSVVTTTSGTAASMNTTTISLPNADLQSLAAEQPYKLRITRRASDTTNDTMADVASLFLVEVKVY